MSGKKDLEQIWVEFCLHVDQVMPNTSRCEFCHERMHATFDNFGNVYQFCVCADWVLMEEEFKASNREYLDNEKDYNDEDFLRKLDD